MKQRLVDYNSDSRLVGIKKVITKNRFLAVASQLKYEQRKLKLEQIQLLLNVYFKLPGSCGTESVLALFKSIDNLNENIMGDTFWTNDRWCVDHTFLLYVWLPISQLLVD